MNDHNMSHQEVDDVEASWGGTIPVEETLGKQTLWVMAAPDQARSFIVHSRDQSGFCGLEGDAVLAEGPELTSEQVQLVQKLVFDPKSYYVGNPIIRRFPHEPNFAFRFIRELITLDLMIDLHNPGWDFCCGSERYSWWNWVNFVKLAKSLFPEYASPHSKSVWKQGAMKSLIAAKNDN